MFGLENMGKFLIFAGVFIAILGLVLVFANKAPFLGRLPGDQHHSAEIAPQKERHQPKGLMPLLNLPLFSHPKLHPFASFLHWHLLGFSLSHSNRACTARKFTDQGGNRFLFAESDEPGYRGKQFRNMCNFATFPVMKLGILIPENRISLIVKHSSDF